uniref:Uncharacterized protein n=1 Tax=Plectus sambesii TaxID=2011161 RepID=A0A914UQU2_9BILA
MRFNQYLTRTDLINQDFHQIIESKYKWPLHNFIEKWAEFCARILDHVKEELTESSYQTATGGLELTADRNQDGVSLISIKLLVQLLHKRMHRLKLCQLNQICLDAEDIHDSNKVVQRAKNR